MSKDRDRPGTGADTEADPAAFRARLEQALDLLDNHEQAQKARKTQAAARAEGERPADLPAPPLPSLLEQCEDQLARIAERPVPPIRLLHQFACTGGTLLARCVGTAPNTILCSEVDPLSTLHLSAPIRPFFPTDLIADLHYSPRPLPDEVRLEMFRASLSVLLEQTRSRGQRVVLRDHAHSQFCTSVDPDAARHWRIS